MELFKDLILVETQKRAKMEIEHSIRIINQIYKEWKKKKRRKNAVDLITASVNKIANIDPSIVDRIHDEGKLKLATILMRCMDNPPWKPSHNKDKIYRRLYPLLDKMQTFVPNTGSGGNLREIIMTRLSSGVCYQEDCENDKRIFVGYEPLITKKYLVYLFGDVIPCKTYRMQSLKLPPEFDTLQETLLINQEKCRERFLNFEN